MTGKFLLRQMGETLRCRFHCDDVLQIRTLKSKRSWVRRLGVPFAHAFGTNNLGYVAYGYWSRLRTEMSVNL